MAVKPEDHQAVLAFRQARKQSTEEGVKEQEGNFAQGFGVGAVTGAVSSAASIVDLIGMGLSNLKESPGLADKVTEFGSEVASGMGPGALQGFEAGNWASVGLPDAGDLAALGVLTIKKRKAVEQALQRPLNELEELVLEQASEIKHDLSRLKKTGWWDEAAENSGLAKLKAKLSEMGLSWDDILPGSKKEYNRDAFPGKSQGYVLDEKGNVIRSREATQMPAPSSQHEMNPLEHSGEPPREFAQPADIWEHAGNYAGKELSHWRGGFNPKGFERHSGAYKRELERLLAKDKAGGEPRAWIYDASKEQLFEVTRKDGKLVMDYKRKGGAFDKFERDPNTGRPLVDESGKYVWNPKIDFVVYDRDPRDLVGEVIETTAKREPQNVTKYVRGEQGVKPSEGKWDADAGDRPVAPSSAPSSFSYFDVDPDPKLRSSDAQLRKLREELAPNWKPPQE